jgi:hypothetical protein
MKGILSILLILSVHVSAQIIGPVSDGVIKAETFGIAADGSNQGAKINALITSLPAGSTIRLERGKVYTSSTTLAINKSITIDGNGASINYTGSTNAILISASNVWIDGLEIYNTYGTHVTSNGLIQTSGTSNTSFIQNVRITNCTIHDGIDVAIRLEYVRNFKLNNNTIFNFPYGGIIVFSGVSGEIKTNEISDITSLGTTGSNAYGIAVSRKNSGTTDTLPRDVTIENNVIKRVLLWEGIDTHGGQKLSVKNNKIYNCSKSIAMVAVAGMTQKDINITDNFCDNDSLGLASEAAIAVEGLSGPSYASGINILGNTCIGGSGGIKLQYTKGVNVIGNTIKKTVGGFGVLLDAQNLQVKVSTNTFIDIMGTGNTAAIKTAGTTVNEVLIESNSLSDEGATVPAGGNKNRYGFRANTTTQTADLVRVRYNNFEAATIAPYGNTNYVRFLGETANGVATITTSSVYAVLPEDKIIIYEYSTGGTTITLPALTSLNDKRELWITNLSSGTLTTSIAMFTKAATSGTTIAAGAKVHLTYDAANSKIWRD